MAETPKKKPQSGPPPVARSAKGGILDALLGTSGGSGKAASPKSGGFLDLLLGAHPTKKATPKKGDADDGITDEEVKTVEKLYEEGIQKALDIIAPSALEIGVRKIELGDGTIARTFFAYNWPSQIHPNWLAPIVNYEAAMDIAEFIYPAPSAAVMKMLKRKVTEMRSSLTMRREKGLSRDPQLEAALQDAEELRDLLARGFEKLFEFGLYITVYADTEEKMKKIQADLESILGGKLVLMKAADFQMEHAWNSTLPLALDELEISRNMNTAPLATSFPFSSSDLTSDQGILYGINRHNESLVIFDRFKLPNANSTVFATSGAGKSYCVKLEVIRYLMMDTAVYIIDPENEYTELAHVMGGTAVPLSIQSNYQINPFDLPKAVKADDEDSKPGELLRSAVINLHGLLKLMIGKTSSEQEATLDKAILDTYALKGITLDTEDPSAKEPPTLHNLVDVLMTTEGGEQMAKILQKFTEGSFAGLFNKQTNIDVNADLMVFQTRDLEESLRPMAIYIVLNFLWNKVRSSLRKRIIVMDEAWNIMQYEDSARFLYGLIKRARKYYLGITTITQDVEDFMNSPYGKPIVTNAAMQILLKQAPSAVDALQKAFNLTEGEKFLLLNAGVGQGVFFAGRKHVAIQIVASPKEHEIVTTNPEELSRRKAQVKAEKAQDMERDAAAKLKAEGQPKKESPKKESSDLFAAPPPQEKEEETKKED
ncbi:MAG TPA: ATP-binding protein [Candidatus Peribacterales bacterium]|nr:ATP-binding protein [Candidatus Peribacterales bacterium]